MAVRNIAVTDTLETFRTQFNDLAAVDFGDIANLDPAISATNLVDAMNETISIATSTAGWTIIDSSATSQIIGGGDTLTVNGTSNQITAVVSGTDTLTIGLPNDVTIQNNLTALGSIHTLGTIEISGNEIRSTDSTRIFVNDTLRAKGHATELGAGRFDETSGFPRLQSFESSKLFIFDATPIFNSSILFEGSSADDFETVLTVVNPTADRTITIPNETGTIVTTGSTGVVTSTMIANGTISADDIADNQISEAKMADDAIGQDQLKQVVNLQILNSSGGILKTLYGAGA